MTEQKFRDASVSIQNQIVKIQETLSSMPDGKLLCSKNKGSVKWYVSDGHTKEYISKKNRRFAERLAIKKYLNLRLKYLYREKRALESYFRWHMSWKDTSEELLGGDSSYRELLAPYFQTEQETLRQWMNMPYVRNLKYPEHLIHKASSGIFVRSKSEAMIERFLYEHGIPFRYECELEINGVTLYPDFTILHPETKRIYYWEHFGRMDDMNYVQGMCSKMLLYAKKGIVPSIQLIATYETKEHPLNYEQVEKIGSAYFLS